MSDPRLDAGGATSLRHEGAEIVARQQPRIPSREELEAMLDWPMMVDPSGQIALSDGMDRAAVATVNLLSLCNMIHLRVSAANLNKSALSSEKERSVMRDLLRFGADPCLPMMAALIRPNKHLADLENEALPWSARKRALAEYTGEVVMPGKGASACLSALAVLVRAGDAPAGEEGPFRLCPLRACDGNLNLAPLQSASSSLTRGLAS